MNHNPENPEEHQERQHKENVVRLDLNVILTTIFGLAIMAGLGGLYAKAEQITAINTKLPYIEAKVDDLQKKQEENAQQISKIPDLLNHQKDLIEADILRNAKKYGVHPADPDNNP